MRDEIPPTHSTIPEDVEVEQVATMSLNKDMDKGTMGTIGSEFCIAHPLADYYAYWFERGQVIFYEEDDNQ